MGEKLIQSLGASLAGSRGKSDQLTLLTIAGRKVEASRVDQSAIQLLCSLACDTCLQLLSVLLAIKACNFAVKPRLGTNARVL